MGADLIDRRSGVPPLFQEKTKRQDAASTSPSTLQLFGADRASSSSRLGPGVSSSWRPLRAWREISLCFVLAAGFFLCSCEKKPSALRFSVRDFGAIADDGLSDGEAVRKCIQTAVAAGQKAVVVFETGNYRIDASPGATAMGELVSLPINKVTNLTLSGARGETTLTFTNPSASGIVLDGCRNVCVENIRIDYDPLPYAFGTIRAVNLAEGTFDLELDDNSTDFSNPLFARARTLWGMVIRPDPKQGTTCYGPVAVGSKTFAPVSGRVWRLTEASLGGAGYQNAIASSGMKPGERYVHMARTYGCAVGIQSCEEARIKNVTILSSPGLSFFPYLSHGVSLVDCHVSPGKDRPISSNADGIHARGLRGDLLVENCSFDGMGDDAINIHSNAILVRKINSPTQIFAPTGTWSVRKGDELVAYDGITLGEKGRTAVESSGQTQGGILISLTKPVEGLRAGQGCEDADRFYNLSEAGGPFVIRNCRFLSHRGRGVLVSGAGGRIENNRFENNEGWGVDLSFGDSIWAEGPPARDLQITGNVFLGRGGSQPCIVVRSSAPKESRISGRRFFKELTIRDNKFLNLRAPAVRLYGVDGVLVENNLLTTDSPTSERLPFAGLEVENSSGVLVRHWKVADPRFGTAVLIGSEVAAGDEGFRIESPGKPPIVADKRPASKNQGGDLRRTMP